MEHCCPLFSLLLLGRFWLKKYSHSLINTLKGICHRSVIIARGRCWLEGLFPFEDSEGSKLFSREVVRGSGVLPRRGSPPVRDTSGVSWRKEHRVPSRFEFHCDLWCRTFAGLFWPRLPEHRSVKYGLGSPLWWQLEERMVILQFRKVWIQDSRNWVQVVQGKENDWGMGRNSCVPSKINSMRKPSNWMGSPYVTVFCVCALGMCTGLWSVNGILGNRLLLHILLEVMGFMKRLHLWSLRRFMISLWYSSVVYLLLSPNLLWA